jgi:hypothetical protein
MKPNPETRIAPAAPGTNTRPPRALPHCFHLPYIQLSGLVRLEQGPSRPIVSGWCTPGAAAAYRGEGPYSRVMFPSADGGPPAVRHVAFSPADRGTVAAGRVAGPSAVEENWPLAVLAIPPLTEEAPNSVPKQALALLPNPPLTEPPQPRAVLPTPR